MVVITKIIKPTGPIRKIHDSEKNETIETIDAKAVVTGEVDGQEVTIEVWPEILDREGARVFIETEMIASVTPPLPTTEEIDPASLL